jgi:cell division protein ZapB
LERFWQPAYIHTGYRLTALARTAHNPPMSESQTKSAAAQELKYLEKRLDELVATIAQLKEENRALRQRQDSLMSERAGLLNKNEQVRARVEAMIGRLKAMEHGT